MLQMSKKCCKYRSGKVVEQNCENWNENYPLWLWQQHFNLSCHFARASCSIRHSPFSILHLPLSILDNLKKPPPLHFIHVAPFDFISYFLLNLCCRSAVAGRGRITRKIIFISFNLNTFSIMQKKTNNWTSERIHSLALERTKPQFDGELFIMLAFSLALQSGHVLDLVSSCNVRLGVL